MSIGEKNGRKKKKKKILTKKENNAIMNIVKRKEMIKMKKLKDYLVYENIVGLGLFLSLLIIAPGIIGNYENHYTRKDCTVVEITDTYVTAVDEFGDEWSWYIKEKENLSLDLGDKVDLKIFNSFTDTWQDDEVVKIK